MFGQVGPTLSMALQSQSNVRNIKSKVQLHKACFTQSTCILLNSLTFHSIKVLRLNLTSIHFYHHNPKATLVTNPMTAASLGRRLAQRVTLTAGCDAVSGGTVDILCDCGLVT